MNKQYDDLHSIIQVEVPLPAGLGVLFHHVYIFPPCRKDLKMAFLAVKSSICMTDIQVAYTPESVRYHAQLASLITSVAALLPSGSSPALHSDSSYSSSGTVSSFRFAAPRQGDSTIDRFVLALSSARSEEVKGARGRGSIEAAAGNGGRASVGPVASEEEAPAQSRSLRVSVVSQSSDVNSDRIKSASDGDGTGASEGASASVCKSARRGASEGNCRCGDGGGSGSVEGRDAEDERDDSEEEELGKGGRDPGERAGTDPET